MFKELLTQLRTGLILMILLTLITGLIYPLLVTGLAQLFFPWQSNGSLIKKEGKFIGSRWIGQRFSDPGYFMGRPSATTPFSYNGASSSGSNSGPSNRVFLETVKARSAQLKPYTSLNHPFIPVDLVTASASGLDPEISPEAAFFQVSRIATVRKIPENEIAALIHRQIQQRTFGILGEPRVNVLQLNLALMQWDASHGR